MKHYGLFEELSRLKFRSNTRALTLDPGTQTTGDPSITVPDMAGTSQSLILTTQTQTLTNKTLTSPSIGTLATFLDNAYAAFRESVGNGTDEARLKAPTSLTGNVIITLPSATTTLVGTDTTDTLTNKTLTTPSINTSATFLDNAYAAFRESVGNGTDEARLKAPPALTGNVTITLPSSTTTLVGTDTTDTLSNKTLASPSVTTLADFSANAVARFENTTNTNHVDLKAPAALATNYTFTLPPNAGSNGQVLQTDGSAVTSWVAVFTSPLTSPGDLIVGGVGGATTRLPFGAAGTVLNNTASGTVSWELAPIAAEGWLSTDILANNRTIASGTTLAYPNASISSGKTLTVTGSLHAAGTITGPGTLAGAGKVFS